MEARMDNEGLLKVVYDSAKERAALLREFLPLVLIGAGLLSALYFLVFAKMVKVFGVEQGIGDFLSGAGLAGLVPAALFAFSVACTLWLVGAALSSSLFVLNAYLKNQDTEEDLYFPVAAEHAPRHMLPMIDATARQALLDLDIKLFSLKYVDSERRWDYPFSAWRAFPLVILCAGVVVTGIQWLLER